jgi:hypothetical protein
MASKRIRSEAITIRLTPDELARLDLLVSRKCEAGYEVSRTKAVLNLVLVGLPSGKR